MKVALAALGFINEDPMHNRAVILRTMEQCAGRADLILFGEAFLQGFYAATFDEHHDEAIALSQDDAFLQPLRDAAKRLPVAVSFGFIEKDGDHFYSSQMTIGKDGQTLDLFRRVSPGWKELHAGSRYREGENFHTFPFMGKKLSVALCGDLWDENNVRKMRALQPDAVLWPVYTDFSAESWNTSLKHEYAVQAEKVCLCVLHVNAHCLDKQTEEDAAKGGCALFSRGSIAAELPAGSEGVLIAEL